MGVGAEIRENLYCGECKNASFLIWDKSDGFDDLIKRGYIVEYRKDGDRENKKFYLIRCGWLKDNVLQPHKLLHCEKREFDNRKRDAQNE